MKKILTLFFILLLGAAMLWGSLNYAGVCISEMKVLSDREKIEIALNAANKSIFTTVAISDQHQTVLKSYKKLPNDLNKYHKNNPHCCVVGMEKVKKGSWPDSEGIPPPTFWKRVTGFYGDVVGLIIPIHYLGDDGTEKVLFRRYVHVIKNCHRLQ